MLYTSAQANKILKKLNEDRDRLQREYYEKSTFVAAIEENIADVKPDFNLKEAELKIAEIEEKIIEVKHAINVFNTTHKVDGMTVDEILILIPQLTQKKKRLGLLALGLEKKREYSSSNHIEYKYANYSIDEAKKMLDEVTNKLSELQLKLDDINRSEATIEITD